MTRTQVRSSNIAEVGYDEETSTLEVLFHADKHGVAALWQYAPVHRSAYEAIIDPSNSAGRNLHQLVKNDRGIVATRLEPVADRSCAS